eukprot:5762006-Amphidinium_carterae.1
MKEAQDQMLAQHKDDAHKAKLASEQQQRKAARRAEQAAGFEREVCEYPAHIRKPPAGSVKKDAAWQTTETRKCKTTL